MDSQRFFKSFSVATCFFCLCHNQGLGENSCLVTDSTKHERHRSALIYELRSPFTDSDSFVLCILFVLKRAPFNATVTDLTNGKGSAGFIKGDLLVWLYVA